MKKSKVSRLFSRKKALVRSETAETLYPSNSEEVEEKEEQAGSVEGELLTVCRSHYSWGTDTDSHSGIFVCAGEVPERARGTLFHTVSKFVYREKDKDIVVLEMIEDDNHCPSRCRNFHSLRTLGTMPADRMSHLHQACLNVNEIFMPLHPVPKCIPWADHVIQDLYMVGMVQFNRKPPPSIYMRRSPHWVSKTYQKHTSEIHTTDGEKREASGTKDPEQ